MRDLGCIQSPQHAFILNLGLESLHVRMPKHVENGQAVAEFLQQHPKVAYVNYPIAKIMGAGDYKITEFWKFTIPQYFIRLLALTVGAVLIFPMK